MTLGRLPYAVCLVCDKVMVALRNADRHDECLECWRELVLLDGLGDVKINDKTYNLVLRATAKAGRWEEMDVVLDMMQVCYAARGVWCLEGMGDEEALKIKSAPSTTVLLYYQ